MAAKKALANISKSLSKEHHPCIHSCLSRAWTQEIGHRQRQAGRHGAATEGRESDTRIDDLSVTGFVADTARQGAAKTTDVAEDLVNLARETDNVAWDSAKNTTRKVTDTLVAEADENVVDTAEYRTIEDLSTFADQNDHQQKDHI